ncbi:PepSY-associated TM helix domain-containing protein [Acidomonas methanolica]|uniref:PepSY-associated TM helix domain-containing protein n=1 Tax=Acidomonas methanolica NBRC 104435 TaxID=1231351 RepID=A0A023D3C7_ACIMT|nr:PepSY-associated TM helix domain-containing protein [Acidomonas methanolica]MBU2655197.1 PepSY domain-containing protein [Acidomonas methanolica]TCS24724.1 putative iron-regulated membrane protein [Acidomonas methanolica]GAJ28250.1 hypothetical protein Amme_016_033 [Acidomonas methanolica NBRC 104435]GEK98757.1 membrane protein [Acidomonas methanolica NBRC 104435]
MTSHALRRWRWLHKWSSIVCTLFLLLLCLTGLPLIFSEEINDYLDPLRSGPSTMRDVTAHVDETVTRARQAWPGQRVRLAVFDPDRARITLRLSPGADDAFDTTHEMTFSAHTGKLLRDGPPPGDAVMDTILQLHVQMLAGLPGELFLGLMGLVFAVAIVSGVALYAPFMRRMRFGEIRWRRSVRVRWLDVHNFLGVATVCWVLIVVLTGVMNTLATPLFGLWEMRDVVPVLKPFMPDAPVIPAASLSRAIRVTEGALPAMTVRFVTFPTHINGSPDHYVVWTQGKSKLRSRFMTPVLVDAAKGEVAFVAKMPWYLRLLELCRPLHFGDYGGVLLKGLWAILDVVTIVVLGSGLYLLLAGKRQPAQAAESRAEWSGKAA